MNDFFLKSNQPESSEFVEDFYGVKWPSTHVDQNGAEWSHCGFLSTEGKDLPMYLRLSPRPLAKTFARMQDGKVQLATEEEYGIIRDQVERARSKEAIKRFNETGSFHL